MLSAFARHFAGRLDAATSALLVFPLFLTYQIGILTHAPTNGVDYLTTALVDLCRRDISNYVALLLAMVAAYVIALIVLRRRGHFSLRSFLPAIAESALYASTMGSLILFVIQRAISSFPLPHLALASGHDPFEIIVISAGAGFHEELVFRAVLMGGLVYALSQWTGRKRAWLTALVVSSVVFSLAHHAGPGAEAFTPMAFVYRTLAGVVFAIIYQVRGFAVATWTHTLYDVYVFSVVYE